MQGNGDPPAKVPRNHRLPEIAKLFPPKQARMMGVAHVF
jgi:hypothetical protein